MFCFLFFTLFPTLPPSDQALSGQAMDRHLNGLKLIAAEAGMETPSLFKDVAYTRSVSHILFTSNVRVAFIAYTDKTFIGGRENCEEVSNRVMVSAVSVLGLQSFWMLDISLLECQSTNDIKEHVIMPHINYRA